MKVRDVMTRPVLAVRRNMPVPAAAAFLILHDVAAAPVVDADGNLVGMVSEGDLFRSPVVRDWWRVQGEPDPTIERFMTKVPVTMRSEDDLTDVAATMLDAGVRSIPIVDDGKLVGIVSRRDVLRAVVRREPIGPEATVP